jgi:hypothetical protein
VALDAGATMINAADAPFGNESVDAGAETLLKLHRLFAKNAEQATRNVDAFCDLSHRVAKIKAFEDRPSEKKDAAIYLANKVDWEGGTIGSLHLPKSLTDRMSTPPQHWLDFTAADYAGLDFEWLGELLEYDTWSMSVTGPMRDFKESAIEAPIPNFISLQQWAKLRLIKGAREGDLPRASLEVQHLAELCASTQTLIGQMIRSAMFGSERTFYERLGVLVPASLPNTEQTQAYRRAAFAGMYFLLPGVPKRVREKAVTCSAARCTALNEALSMTSSVRAALPEAQETLDWLMSQSPCDSALAERISKSAPVTDEALSTLLDGSPDIDALLNFDGGTW